MTRGFRPVRGGVSVRLDADEAAVLRSMAELVLGLVEEPGGGGDDLAALVGIDGGTERPEDPVLARLLPDAYTEPGGAAPDGGGESGPGRDGQPDAAEANSDFRRYTEGDLRRHKRENAQTVVRGVAELPRRGGELVLGPEEAHAWMKALNDVRIALGTRLGVEEEGGATSVRGTGSGEADAAALDVYEWLGGLQETLVQSLLRMR
ncbi:DUF2017 domain-containing protein [Nocardiopsis coralliicola]